MRKPIAALLLMLVPQSVPAQELPYADFYVGIYELVGRGPGPDFKPLSDLVTMTTTGDGYPLTLRSCRLGAGTLGPAPDSYEGAPPLSGPFNGWQISCRSQTNGDNYPILSCYSETGGAEQIGLFTLWPASRGFLPPELEACP